MKYNTKIQEYKGIKFRLIKYTEKHFNRLRAKRFLLISGPKKSRGSQNFWIPNCYLEIDGTLKQNSNIDFIFLKMKHENKLKYVGIEMPNWLKGK